jgi:integrase
MHLRGVPTAVISKWLGHATASFTMSVYVHSQDDALALPGPCTPRPADLTEPSVK